METGPTESGVTTLRRRGWYKRPFDLVVLAATHVALLPVFLLLWTLVPLAIWLDDRGPVFYIQRRVGRDGRLLRLFKFRSMVPGAESHTGPVWATENDPRTTRVGRFLRATALDELPQVINLWKGELSLVGPRPERPELYEEFAKEAPGFDRRLEVRPGLTGLAQVRGRYATRPKDKLRYDNLYMRRMSPLLDVKLLFLSVIITLKAGWQATEGGHR